MNKMIDPVPGGAGRWLLIGAGALAALTLGVVVLVLIAGATTPATTAPRAQWAAHKITHYDIEVQVSGFMAWCTMRAEVQGERVTRLDDDTTGEFCDGRPATVAGLFDAIDRYGSGQRCGPGGCGCDGPITTAVKYDPALGYPRQIVVQTDTSLRWRYPDYWISLLPFATRRCNAMAFFGPTIEVKSLTPLP